MDKFAIQKGLPLRDGRRRCPMRKRVLWVGRGRGRDDVRPFFEWAQPRGLQAAARWAVIDMNAGYEQEVRRHCPQAAIVYDLFHVVAKYGREVIDRVRVNRANGLRADKPARRVVKGARWLLLRNRESLAPGQRVRLERAAGGQPGVDRGRRAERRAEGPPGEHRYAGYAERAWKSWYDPSQAEPGRAAQALRHEPQAPPARRPGGLPIPSGHEPHGGSQQPDQGHQAHGLRLPRRRLLLPQDPRRVPRQ